MMQLLDKILQFNPYFRPSAFECLSDNVFDEVRDMNNELQSSYKFILSIDKDGQNNLI